MCLYSAVCQGLSKVPGHILAPDVQERALGVRGADEGCKGMNIPVRRNGREARRAGGIGGTGADAEGSFRQGGTGGAQVACGLGPGF